MRPAAVISLCLLGAVLPLHALTAQEWHLSTEAGRIRLALDPRQTTASVSLGLRYEDVTTGLRLTAGIPTRSGEALWGGVGASKRLAFRANSFTAGVDVLGNALLMHTRQSEVLPVPGPFDPPTPARETPPQYAIAGQVMPMIGYEGVRFQVRGRAGVSRYRSRMAGQGRDRVVRLVELQAAYVPAMSLAIVPILQHARAEAEPAAVFAGASVVGAHSSGTVTATLGRWSPDSTATPQWSVGARWRLHPNLTFDASARRATLDPLYQQPAQMSWSVGLSVLLGRARTMTAPVPASYGGGLAVIRLTVTASPSAPSIAGDFNGWKPAPMQRAGDYWTYTATMSPGVYHYAFVNSAGEWFVPEGVAGRKSDGMGGHVAVLVVR